MDKQQQRTSQHVYLGYTLGANTYFFLRCQICFSFFEVRHHRTKPRPLRLSLIISTPFSAYSFSGYTYGASFIVHFSGVKKGLNNDMEISDFACMKRFGQLYISGGHISACMNGYLWSFAYTTVCLHGRLASAYAV
jgi:hypothetical protein